MLIYKPGTGRGAGVMENIARYFATNKGRAKIKLIVRRSFKTSNIENLLPTIIITTAPLPQTRWSNVVAKALNRY